MAIPAGTYVEGMVNAVASAWAVGDDPLYADAVCERLLGAAGCDEHEGGGGVAGRSSRGPQRVGELAWGGPPVVPMYGNQTNPTNPTLPPLPDEGPSKGAMIGGALGGMAALVVVLVLTTHHRGSGNYVLFDSGWQFQMVLAAPLTLDGGRLPAAS